MRKPGFISFLHKVDENKSLNNMKSHKSYKQIVGRESQIKKDLSSTLNLTVVQLENNHDVGSMLINLKSCVAVISPQNSR